MEKPKIKILLPSEILYYGLTEEAINTLGKGRLGFSIYLSLTIFFFTSSLTTFLCFFITSITELPIHKFCSLIIITVLFALAGFFSLVECIIKAIEISKLIKNIMEKQVGIQEESEIQNKENKELNEHT